MTMEQHVRKSYAFGSILLTLLLTGCSIALIALVLQWHSFTSDDGIDVRFPVEGLENLEVKEAASLLWSCVLVLPLCFTGLFLVCFLKRFMVILMVLLGLLGFASNVYASVNFREIYDKINIIFDDEDSFDERCNSASYNNVQYCMCNIGKLDPPENATIKMLKFRVKECDDLEDVTGKFYMFFKLSMTTSFLSAIILFMSMLELCIPLKKMSAVLLQNEGAQNYESTNQHDKNTEPRTCKVRFDNPVYVQCNKTGQSQSVFWYPYSSSTNATNSGGLIEQSGNQTNNLGNVTLSSFKSARDHSILNTVE